MLFFMAIIIGYGGILSGIAVYKNGNHKLYCAESTTSGQA
jgi:hypothetical protein